MKKLTTALSSIFFVFSAYADFENEKKDIQIAIKEVLQKDGDANKEDAERFWKKIPKNNEAVKAMNLLVDEYFTPINNVQYEMWFCVKTAWIEKKINDCQKARNLMLTFENKLGKDNFDATTNLRKLTLLIQTAAKNENYFKIEGEESDFSLAIINKTVERIDKASENLKFVIKNK